MSVLSTLTLVLLVVAIMMVVGRLLWGPTLADRVVALDVLTAVAIGVIAAYTAATGATALLDAALVLALVAFLATVAFAQFIEQRVSPRSSSRTEPEDAVH